MKEEIYFELNLFNQNLDLSSNWKLFFKVLRMSVNFERSTYTFAWSVENFSLCSQAHSESILSPVFLVEILNDAQFYLSLYPKGKTQKDVVYCDFSRAEDDCGPEMVEFELTLSVCAKNDLKKTITRSCNAKRKSDLISGLEIPVKDLFEENKVYLPNDIINFQCCLNPKFSKIKSSKKCYANTLVQAEKHSFVVPWISTQFATSITAFVPFQNCFFNAPLHCLSEHGKFDFEICSCVNIIEKGRIKIRRTATNDSKKKLFIVFKAFLNDYDFFVSGEKTILPDENEWEILFSADKSLLEFVSRNEVFPIRWDFAISDGKYTTAPIKLVHNSFEDLRYRYRNFRFETGKNPTWKAMYDDKKFCDVTLKVENTSFPAHKSVLCACSPVFSSMFESDMKEKETGVVQISDMTKETLLFLLGFVYTGAVDLQQNTAVDLYISADKYQINELKLFCSSFLMGNLTVENVCDVLDIADLYQDTDLERKARSYINSHTERIFVSKEWESFMEKRLKLAADIMLDLCRKIHCD